MAISDPSDSDSTLIVDQVKSNRREKPCHLVLTDSNFGVAPTAEDEMATFTNESPMNYGQNQMENKTEIRGSSPLTEDDCSDVDSLHSFHYSPKAVDMPSAVRLAKRLYTLDGFKKSDVSRHLSKK